MGILTWDHLVTFKDYPVTFVVLVLEWEGKKERSVPALGSCTSWTWTVHVILMAGYRIKTIKAQKFQYIVLYLLIAVRVKRYSWVFFFFIMLFHAQAYDDHQVTEPENNKQINSPHSQIWGWKVYAFSRSFTRGYFEVLAAVCGPPADSHNERVVRG